MNKRTRSCSLVSTDSEAKKIKTATKYVEEDQKRKTFKKENNGNAECSEKRNKVVENNIIKDKNASKNVEAETTEHGNGDRGKSLGEVPKSQKRKKSVTYGRRKRKHGGKNRLGVTRNQCVCGPNGAEPAKSQLVEDHEAHMLVAEWRLHKFQSPIELSHEESITHDHFDPLEFHGHWDNDGVATFTNTGKTVVLRFSERATPYLVGGPLHKDTYCFEQLHFHWSDDDSGGCEHIFEGRAYSMEAHAVHYNLKYGSFKDAVDKPDGLAVIGFFLEATDNEDNPCFSEMVKGVQNVIKINTTTNIAPDCLNWIKEEAQCKGYYTYQGSLTTEPYLESVTWILYPTPIHVSRQQVAYFRELKSTACEKINIVNNVRPIQSPPADKKINVIFARSHKQSE